MITVLLIAGCATNTPSTTQNEQTNSIAHLDKTNFQKQGRLSIKVESETPQSLSGAFEIKGTALQGDLSVFSPIGSTVAQVSWSPTQAILMANNETKQFDHIDALMLELTGTVLPLTALFDWLMAIPTPAAGWQVDLSQMQHAQRPRLFAKRTTPLPLAELRLVLEP
ncbi:MAG TPA: outer membrane lipoprotein LolB [Burkholderiaceae bacterium]|nr:outer membrane lipoprotein LolB [Burkholderiaceae bacterium]